MLEVNLRHRPQVAQADGNQEGRDDQLRRQGQVAKREAGSGRCSHLKCSIEGDKRRWDSVSLGRKFTNEQWRTGCVSCRVALRTRDASPLAIAWPSRGATATRQLTQPVRRRPVIP